MIAEPLALEALEDGAFVAKHPLRAARLYPAGTHVVMVPYEPRSQNSHDHFFAIVADAWANLPEDQVGRFGDSEHLRKWCLIRAGYRDERTMVCASNAEALKLAAFIRPMDDFAVVTVERAVVSVFTAKSQSMKAMGAKVFQESKDAVFGVLAGILGIDPTTLAQQAGRAA